jgi:thiol-disulfide isomerase/thioredoxin
MCCAEPRRGLLAAALLLAGAACGMGADLFPSGADRRPPALGGTTGPAVGQAAPDFTRPDALGADVSLYSTLTSAPGVILYFNMWCPICDAHMTELRRVVRPAFPDVPVLVVDYVSGSVAQSRAAQLQMGWDVPDFTFLVDAGGGLEKYYASPMALVVVDRDHVVRLRGELDWTRLQPVLAALPR